jgi:leucyl aminopeptidase
MRVEVSEAAPGEVEADLLAVAAYEGGLTGGAAELDALLDGRLARLASDGELTGKLGTVAVLHVDGGLRAGRVAVAGLGRRDAADADALRTAAAAAARAARVHGGTLAWLVDGSLPVAGPEQARLAVEGASLAAYDPGQWKTRGPRDRPLERLLVVGGDGVGEPARRAGIVSAWANRARDLVNTPPNEAPPARFAERAEEIAAGGGSLSATVLGPREIEALGMGALSAVGRASRNEPRLVAVHYDPPGPARPDVVLGFVGKGITFDTGGVSLKPGLHMEDMKGDMAGGAAVLEAIGAVAELELPVRVVTVVAAAENMPGGGAYRPGDILTAANGKTIEIVNTDAEGRLVLADALWYARREGATHVVDLATLTGAMVIALGDLYSGFYANDEEWASRIAAAGERSGDHAWRLPLHPRYRRYVDSVFADMKNASDLREAGAALAAEFLREFAGDGPWAHVDIAGPAYLRRSRGDYLTQHGGTGYGVRLLVELAAGYTA